VNPVRVGVIGTGNMGGAHLGYLPDVKEVQVTAVCDTDKAKADKWGEKLGVKSFATADELLASKLCDMVIIATPHYDHPPIGIKALQTGHHVLVEKPIAVGTKAALELIAEAKKHPNLKFGIMFNQRSNPIYQKVRSLIQEGELGEISRVTWLITDWFRTWTYYASGGWRATWAGEGGGVLINQCPHNLDLIQWITGLMPSRITAVGFVGKTHPIEVEDEMSAILEYPNGAIGHFVTSTGEAPGTNRLEICGEMGKFVVENNKILFYKNRKSCKVINQTSPEAFAWVENWTCEIPYGQAPKASEHERVFRNYVSAILNNTPMLAPGEEGVHGLSIGNAMLMSAMTKKPVDLPIDGAAYEQLLLDLAKQFGGKKTLQTKKVDVDMAASSKSF
jgi:predicted dehydrogenase